MADQQQIIDELIDYIDKAVLKHSVSNRHVAEVLYWLNEGLKKVSTDGLKDIFISKKQIDETNFYFVFWEVSNLAAGMIPTESRKKAKLS